jgi:hypothetical protein
VKDVEILPKTEQLKHLQENLDSFSQHLKAWGGFEQVMYITATMVEWLVTISEGKLPTNQKTEG